MSPTCRPHEPSCHPHVAHMSPPTVSQTHSPSSSELSCHPPESDSLTLKSDRALHICCTGIYISISTSAQARARCSDFFRATAFANVPLGPPAVAMQCLNSSSTYEALRTSGMVMSVFRQNVQTNPIISEHFHLLSWSAA
jgi:hypothetical protein